MSFLAISNLRELVHKHKNRGIKTRENEVFYSIWWMNVNLKANESVWLNRCAKNKGHDELYFTI